MIKYIRIRMAECNNPKLQAVNLIPPQLFSRYTTLSIYARDLRMREKNLKTQLRYGTRDVELWTKYRGENERYTLFPMEDIENDCQMPKFNHTARWNRKQERPPRRKVSPSRGDLGVPSMENSLNLSQS